MWLVNLYKQVKTFSTLSCFSCITIHSIYAQYSKQFSQNYLIFSIFLVTFVSTELILNGFTKRVKYRILAKLADNCLTIYEYSSSFNILHFFISLSIITHIISFCIKFMKFYKYLNLNTSFDIIFHKIVLFDSICIFIIDNSLFMYYCINQIVH